MIRITERDHQTIQLDLSCGLRLPYIGTVREIHREGGDLFGTATIHEVVLRLKLLRNGEWRPVNWRGEYERVLIPDVDILAEKRLSHDMKMMAEKSRSSRAARKASQIYGAMNVKAKGGGR
jgi:hypothetical protein